MHACMHAAAATLPCGQANCIAGELWTDALFAGVLQGSSLGRVCVLQSSVIFRLLHGGS